MTEEHAAMKQPHNLILQNRKDLSVSGVTEVVSFDENTVVLITALGELTVRGFSLHISKIQRGNRRSGAGRGNPRAFVYGSTRSEAERQYFCADVPRLMVERMESWLVEETLLFLKACALGAVLGACYDGFRILRAAVRFHTVLVFVQDVLYFVGVTIVTFAFLLAYNDGELRMFILIGELMGAGAVFLFD